ncbi:hypothetical protein JCM10207_001252 [Rhodosporidiobolus poonsookiae]
MSALGHLTPIAEASEGDDSDPPGHRLRPAAPTPLRGERDALGTTLGGEGGRGEGGEVAGFETTGSSSSGSTAGQGDGRARLAAQLGLVGGLPSPRRTTSPPAQPHASTSSARLSPPANCDEEDATTSRRLAFAEAKALYETGLSVSSRGDALGATQHFRQAATVFSSIQVPGRGMKSRVEKCLWQEGMAWAKVGMRARKKKGPQRRELARQAFDEARSLFSFIGETSKEAMALYQLGLVTDDPLAAAEHIKRAALLFGELDQGAQEAMCFAEIAHLFGRDDPDAGIYYLKQCLLLYLKLSDTRKEAKALFAIASLAAHLDPATARAYYRQARVVFRRRGDTMDEANCAYQLGKLAVAGKTFESAVSYFEEASTLFHQAGAKADEAWSLYRLALVMLKVKTPEIAVDYLEEARNLFSEAGDEKPAEGSCLLRMGEILGESNPTLAKICVQQALALVNPRSERIGRRATVYLRKLEGSGSGGSGGSEPRRRGGRGDPAREGNKAAAPPAGSPALSGPVHTLGGDT